MSIRIDRRSSADSRQSRPNAALCEAFWPDPSSVLPRQAGQSFCAPRKANPDSTGNRTRPLPSAFRVDRGRASTGDVGPLAKVSRWCSSCDGRPQRAGLAKWFSESVRQHFDAGVSQTARRIACAIELLEYPYASAEDDPTSFLWTLRENWYEAQETTRYKISGGNDLLPKAFAAKLKEKIHYGSPVVRIEQDSNKVRAIAVQSGTHHTFEADRLICTVPFPALRRVEVQPPFSERKRKAIAELTYDPVTRVILQCRSRFWEKDGYNGFGIHPTFDQPGTRGLLVSYLLTGVGKRVGAMDPDRRTEFVSREMEKVYPGLLNHLEGCVSKVWPADPWAGGAGAEHSPGQLTTFCVGIERAEGRVHFAGEHTSGYPYWMQGALQSGLRAAEEVNEPR